MPAAEAWAAEAWAVAGHRLDLEVLASEEIALLVPAAEASAAAGHRLDLEVLVSEESLLDRQALAA